jgi:hypothetical protein
MNLNIGWTELNSSMKTLRVCWDETKAHWDDTVQEDFEKNFWDPLDQQVRATLRGIERLAPSLIKLRRDCGAGPDAAVL